MTLPGKERWRWPRRGTRAGLVPEGTVFRSQTASLSNLSRISQLNMPGFSRLYSSIFFSTSGVVTCFKRTGRQVLRPSPLGPLGRAPLLAEGSQLSKAVHP